MASMDALACSQLWAIYRQAMSEQGITIYRDLTQRRAYKFLQSFSLAPLSVAATAGLLATGRFKSRKATRGITGENLHIVGVREYWDALKAAVADLEITAEEAGDLREKRERHQLTVEEMRAVHGRVFAAALAETLEDVRITDAEWGRLRGLHRCLEELGWAPGA
jgi:hypothetical protein